MFVLKKSAFEPGLLSLQDRGLFPNSSFFVRFLPNPYTRMCVLTIGSFSLLGNKMKNHCKLQIRSWFFGFPLIFDFSVYFDHL